MQHAEQLQALLPPRLCGAEHVTLPVPPRNAEPAWHLYAVTHPNADALLAELNRAGVQARAYYRRQCHHQPAMARFIDRPPALTVTERIGAENIALPISPVLGEAQAREVVDVLAAVAVNA